MEKGSPKWIGDAERNRRTLEKPASHVAWFGGGAMLQINETGAENGIVNQEKGTKMGPKIDAKSSRRRGGVRGAFWEAKNVSA